jgi:hypothetical protein
MMNDDLLRIQAMIQEMKQLVDALTAVADELPNDPKFFASQAEAPLEQLEQKREEVDQLFDRFKPPSLRQAARG